mmetsp:Transcript_12389/g.35963  ORF Transcript_12389/g.35963 Transcript_12389/m.35963 type:complete len:216 (-) Transcript_12389:1275-1922(-)
MRLELVHEDEEYPLRHERNLGVVGHAILQHRHAQLRLDEVDEAFTLTHGVARALHDLLQQFQTEHLVAQGNWIGGRCGCEEVDGGKVGGEICERARRFVLVTQPFGCQSAQTSEQNERVRVELRCLIRIRDLHVLHSAEYGFQDGEQCRLCSGPAFHGFGDEVDVECTSDCKQHARLMDAASWRCHDDFVAPHDLHLNADIDGFTAFVDAVQQSV